MLNKFSVDPDSLASLAIMDELDKQSRWASDPLELMPVFDRILDFPRVFLSDSLRLMARGLYAISDLFD